MNKIYVYVSTDVFLHGNFKTSLKLVCKIEDALEDCLRTPFGSFESTDVPCAMSSKCFTSYTLFSI